MVRLDLFLQVTVTKGKQPSSSKLTRLLVRFLGTNLFSKIWTYFFAHGYLIFNFIQMFIARTQLRIRQCAFTFRSLLESCSRGHYFVEVQRFLNDEDDKKSKLKTESKSKTYKIMTHTYHAMRCILMSPTSAAEL